MAAAFRSISSTTYASRTNTTIPAPAGIVDGDILLAEVFTGASSSAPTATPPVGFTALDTPTSNSDPGSFNGKSQLFWKRAASESGSYTFTHAAASSQGAILAISGAVTSGSPIDAYSKNGGLGPTSTATGVTTTAADDLLVWASHDWVGGGALTPPSGFTERFDSLIYAATAVQASAGATGNKTQTSGNNSAGVWAAWLVAIKSAPSGNTLTADFGTYLQIGLSIALKAARRLFAAPGAYNQAGQAASVKASRRVAADAGSYSTAGQSIGIRRSLRLAVATGSYAQSGQASGLRASRRLAAATGAYAVSGAAARLVTARRLSADAGSYAVDGQSIDFAYSPVSTSYLLSAVPGAYLTAGFAAALKAGHRLLAQSGQYQTVGQAAGLSLIKRFALASGQYAVAGISARLLGDRRLALDVGSYAQVGKPVQFVVERLVVIPTPASRIFRAAPEVRLFVASHQSRIFRPTAQARVVTARG